MKYITKISKHNQAIQNDSYFGETNNDTYSEVLQQSVVHHFDQSEEPVEMTCSLHMPSTEVTGHPQLKVEDHHHQDK